MPVHFFKEEILFEIKNKLTVKRWVKEVVKSHGFTLGDINYIFCSDEHLLRINKEFLDHDYYTDIITFDQSEEEGQISGDIYISVDRVEENSNTSSSSFNEELRRVMIHGVLHLIGYEDGSQDEKVEMRKKEEACLSLYPKK